LARVLQPSTERLLDQVGIGPGMHCLDLGCGGGDVTRLLAQRVGPSGRVLAIDQDASILALARQEAEQGGWRQVQFQQGDATRLHDQATVDVVYARFLLTHLPNVDQVLAAMRQALRRSGVVVVEDIDFAGHVCHPPSRAVDRYVELYRAVVRRRGGDADVGPRLPGGFVAAGLAPVGVHLVQPVALEGESKLVAALTLQRIAGALSTEGLATPEEVQALVEELTALAADRQTLLSLPRIFQVWGRKL
jgi:SAM-dependent methyltransferase